jgi:hypothetical protein
MQKTTNLRSFAWCLWIAWDARGNRRSGPWICKIQENIGSRPSTFEVCEYQVRVLLSAVQARKPTKKHVFEMLQKFRETVHGRDKSDVFYSTQKVRSHLHAQFIYIFTSCYKFFESFRCNRTTEKSEKTSRPLISTCLQFWWNCPFNV